MSKLGWYWHRLRAMSPREMLLHARKKFRQAADARRTEWPKVDLTCSGAFPELPKTEDAPEALREALRRDVENILAGRWRFFGHLELQVDDPPKWQYDYLVRRNMESLESAFKLNYRTLPDGVDSKLIWEPSRWYQVVRLAMAAYVLNDCRAGEKCVAWLEDWVKHNPPYRGWNWTSALEVGLRLIQFAWIDALLEDLRFASDDLRGGGETEGPVVNRESKIVNGSGARLADRLAKLRSAILPAHVFYAWRHKSFGSSANNHLLGELVGCIVATVRWPGLAGCGASLEELQRRWEHEVLAQFTEDGGNKEQALNYQLFSWVFCWQARMALMSASRKISPEVDERLRQAAQFFVDVQVPGDPWDYGDSDNAFVVPLFVDETKVVAEWHEWFRRLGRGSGIEYWVGSSVDLPGSWRAKTGVQMPGVTNLDKSGQAILQMGDWRVRFDYSLLGYLNTAAHGHLDGLHLSIWIRGIACVVDPGTGAYHADKKIRNWLASRGAHNCPCPATAEWPRRIGPFLWQQRHSPAGLAVEHHYLEAGLCLKDEILERRFEPREQRDGFSIEDRCLPNGGGDPIPFSVRWQFAPASRVDDLDMRRFRVTRHGVSIEVQVSPDWAEVFCVTQQSQVARADPESPLAGTVSPAFRKTVWAPYLKLVARPAGDKPCVFRTTFLVLESSRISPSVQAMKAQQQG